MNHKIIAAVNSSDSTAFRELARAAHQQIWKAYVTPRLQNGEPGILVEDIGNAYAGTTLTVQDYACDTRVLERVAEALLALAPFEDAADLAHEIRRFIRHSESPSFSNIPYIINLCRLISRVGQKLHLLQDNQEPLRTLHRILDMNDLYWLGIQPCNPDNETKKEKEITTILQALQRFSDTLDPDMQKPIATKPECASSNPLYNLAAEAMKRIAAALGPEEQYGTYDKPYYREYATTIDRVVRYSPGKKALEAITGALCALAPFRDAPLYSRHMRRFIRYSQSPAYHNTPYVITFGNLLTRIGEKLTALGKDSVFNKKHPDFIREQLRRLESVFDHTIEMLWYHSQYQKVEESGKRTPRAARKRSDKEPSVQEQATQWVIKDLHDILETIDLLRE